MLSLINSFPFRLNSNYVLDNKRRGKKNMIFRKINRNIVSFLLGSSRKLTIITVTLIATEFDFVDAANGLLEFFIIIKSLRRNVFSVFKAMRVHIFSFDYFG